MFCRKCGKEISDGVVYCSYCGEKTNAEIGKAEYNKALAAKKMLFIRGSMVFVAVLCMAMCFFVLPKIQFEQHKDDVQAEVDKAFENGDYEKVIENSEDLLVYAPEVEDNYIKLATAYVETGDLYQAKSILQTGYLNTQDESLVNVSITGSLACYERIMLIAGDVLWPSISIRCEYVFTDEKVTAKLYGCDGMTSATLEYYFSEKEERVSGGLLEGYFSIFGINTEVDKYLYSEGESLLDYWYNEDGELVSITYKEGQDNIELVTMQYVGGKCTSVNSLEGSYEIEYDNKGRMTGMKHSWDGYISFGYNQDGSYEEKQVYESHMVTIKYDKNGLMKSICYQDVEDEETGTSISYENKKVVCMDSTCNNYWGKLEYEYEPDGKISNVLMYSSIQGESEKLVGKLHYKYNDINQVIDISVEYEKNITDNLRWYFECGSWHIDYNENGQISCATRTGNENMEYQKKASYWENGDFKIITEIGAEYRIETNYHYDEHGRRVRERTEYY